MSDTCYVYLFGYPHAQFGHVVKVGISSNPSSRLATIQSTNPDTVIPHFHFEFRTRYLARSVESAFHKKFSHYGIRGEWFGMTEAHALFMLTMEVVRTISNAYPKETVASVRRESGLLDAFEILDREADDNQASWNDEWCDVEEVFA